MKGYIDQKFVITHDQTKHIVSTFKRTNYTSQANIH